MSAQMAVEQILERIPQRPPFLFVEKIIEETEKGLQASYKIKKDEYFFKGHFPGRPTVPGVILQEALFQTGALFLSSKAQGKGVGMVTRVDRAKFRRQVLPQDELNLYVELIEKMGEAYLLQGFIKKDNKTVVSLQFMCATAE